MNGGAPATLPGHAQAGAALAGLPNLAVMDACETCLVQNDAASGDLVRWLHAFVGALPPPRGGFWMLGPRDFGQDRNTAMIYLPQPYETLAFYAMPHNDPFSPGQVAFSITPIPLRQRRLILELRRWPPLPVALATVVDHMAAYFSASPTTVASAAPRRRGRGAPPLACNAWLERQLAGLPPHTGLRPLYAQWIEQYRAVRGSYPAAPQRSFRAAVAGCRQRMRRSKRTR